LAKRRLVAFAFGFTLGVLYGPAVHPILDVLGGLLLIGVGRRRRFQIPLLAPLFIAGGGFLIGVPVPGVMMETSEALSSVPGAFAPGGIELEGVVAEAPDHGLRADGLVVDVEVPARGRVLIRVPDACAGPRDRIRVTARLSLRRPSLLPSFRSRRLAVRRGVHLYGEAIAPCEVVAKDALGAAARSISDRIASSTASHAELLAGLATGRRPSAARSEAPLVMSGLGSLLELHGVALALIFGLLFLTFRRHPLSILALAPLVLLFGATPSILRVAVVLGCLFLPKIRAELDALDSLAIAVVAVLAVSPAGLGDVRFQLAFAAISAGLRFPREVRAASRHSVAILVAGGAMAAGTFPLAARLFDHVTITSLALAPFGIGILQGIVAPLALIGGLLASIASILGTPFLWLAGTIAGACLSALPSSAPGAFPTPTVLECALFYLAIAALAAPRDPERARWLTRRRAALLLLGACVASMLIGALDRPTELRAYVLPVTRGQAYVVEHPELGVLVRDTAEPAAWFQMEQRVVANHLKLRRRSRIDVLLERAGDDPSAADELALQLDVVRRQPIGDELRFEALGRSIVFVDTGTATADVVVTGSRVVADRVYDASREGLLRIMLGDPIEVTPFIATSTRPVP
jgi:hypothetical protein